MPKFLAGLLAGALAVCAGYALASRNSTGTYSLITPGNPVVNGTTITPSWANNTLSDLSTEMTDSLSRSGKGGMLAPLRTTDGTVASPAHSFTNEPGSGLYRIGASDYGFSLSGVLLAELSATGLTVNVAAGNPANFFTPTLAAGSFSQILIGGSGASNNSGGVTFRKNATPALSTLCLDVFGQVSTLCVDGNAKTTATGALASASLAVTGAATVGTTLAVTGATTATGGITIGSGGSAVVSFLVGSCTLNGGTPSVCTSSVQTTAKCVCTYGSSTTAHTVACAVAIGTLTVVSATNGDVATVNWACWN